MICAVLKVLNLFLALLLNSFGGDALKGDDDEDGTAEKKKSRLQKLIDWTKRKARKKSQEEQKDIDANMVGQPVSLLVTSKAVSQRISKCSEKSKNMCRYGARFTHTEVHTKV